MNYIVTTNAWFVCYQDRKNPKLPSLEAGTPVTNETVSELFDIDVTVERDPFHYAGETYYFVQAPLQINKVSGGGIWKKPGLQEAGLLCALEHWGITLAPTQECLDSSLKYLEKFIHRPEGYIEGLRQGLNASISYRDVPGEEVARKGFPDGWAFGRKMILIDGH